MRYILTHGISQAPSPNFASGRGADKVRAIVVHKSEGSKASCISWFQSPASQVSAHYLVGLDGSVTQFVSADDTAWHAGVVKDATADVYIEGTNPNAYTIGIELEGYAEDGTPTLQLAALNDLLVDICMSYALTPSYDSIIFHRHIDKIKTCPGDWVDRRAIVELARSTMFTVLAGKLPVKPR